MTPNIYKQVVGDDPKFDEALTKFKEQEKTNERIEVESEIDFKNWLKLPITRSQIARLEQEKAELVEKALVRSCIADDFVVRMLLVEASAIQKVIDTLKN